MSKEFERRLKSDLVDLANGVPQIPFTVVDVIDVENGDSVSRPSLRSHRWGGLAAAASVAFVAVGASFIAIDAPGDQSSSDSSGGFAISATPTRHDDSSSPVSRETPAPYPDVISTNDFPTNSHGETYGSDAAVVDFETGLPDLIAVIAENGARGFMRKEDFYTDTDVVGPKIKVYDVEGEVQVGTYIVGPPTKVYGDAPPLPIVTGGTD